MPTFVHAGQRLAYNEYGEGRRTIVLLPGLLLPSRMHDPLARDLAHRGNRVVTLDLLGHGESDKPRDMWRYSIPIFGREVVALLDHLEVDEAVVGGTSLGANTTLEVAALAPSRVRGMVVEMPVLDNALLGCAIAFTPLLISLTFGAPITGPAAALLRRVPRVFGHYPDVLLDWLSREPGPSAAILQGIFFGRTAPPREERKTFEAPVARARAPARRDPPLLRREDARRGAAQRPPDRGQLAVRAAPAAAPAHERDRRVPGRVLAPAPHLPAAPRARRA